MLCLLAGWDAGAFCGVDGQVGASSVGIKAAHVRWFSRGGSNGWSWTAPVLRKPYVDEGVQRLAEQPLALSADLDDAERHCGIAVHRHVPLAS